MNHAPDPAEERTRRLRVRSCQSLIRDVRRRLESGGRSPRVVEQLGRLDQIMSLLGRTQVSDDDLERIEFCLNQLMQEMSALFQHHRLGHLYPVRYH